MLRIWVDLIVGVQKREYIFKADETFLHRIESMNHGKIDFPIHV